MDEQAEASMLSCGTSCTYRIGQYIVKIPRLDLEDGALSEQHLHHAVREANAYRILQSHDRIAKCMHACPIGGLVALEYYRNGNLKAYVDKHGPTRLLTWAKQMVESLEYIHSKGVRHSDLRLDQWLLDSDLNVRLSDFNGSGYDGCMVLGIEAKMNSALESGAYFMPRDPELASTVRSDLFALGTSLYVLETGSTPFAQGDEATISHRESYDREEAITERFARGEFPSVASLALGSMIKGAWEGRFDSATEMLDVWDSEVRSGGDRSGDGRVEGILLSGFWSDQAIDARWMCEVASAAPFATIPSFYAMMRRLNSMDLVARTTKGRNTPDKTNLSQFDTSGYKACPALSIRGEAAVNMEIGNHTLPQGRQRQYSPFGFVCNGFSLYELDRGSAPLADADEVTGSEHFIKGKSSSVPDTKLGVSS
ncbi:hypothetical protein LTR17_011150 [Elasticomyces elasticus]|nr:hypothetical protein LTR17_011150 [Elasticomyces elasticus]